MVDTGDGDMSTFVETLQKVLRSKKKALDLLDSLFQVDGWQKKLEAALKDSQKIKELYAAHVVEQTKKKKQYTKKGKTKLYKAEIDICLDVSILARNKSDAKKLALKVLKEEIDVLPTTLSEIKRKEDVAANFLGAYPYSYKGIVGKTIEEILEET